MKKKPLLRHVTARPRLFGTLAVGAVVSWLLPMDMSLVSRALMGWNVAVWLYLASISVTMARADHEHLQRTASAYAEGAAIVMTGIVCAVAASLAAIMVELSTAKTFGGYAITHVVSALATLVGSWLLLPTLFALSYASVYYSAPEGGRGLDFPGEAKPYSPSYTDFMYFAVTIAATAQTSDVAVTTRRMRRWVLSQSLLAFAFNTTLLALAINIAAGLL